MEEGQHAHAAIRQRSVPRRNTKACINRLNRIEGQVRGIKQHGGEGCVLSGYPGAGGRGRNAALNSFSKELLANHIRTCVANDIRDGKEETIDELVATIQKLMR